MEQLHAEKPDTARLLSELQAEKAAKAQVVRELEAQKTANARLTEELEKIKGDKDGGKDKKDATGGQASGRG